MNLTLFVISAVVRAVRGGSGAVGAHARLRGNGELLGPIGSAIGPSASRPRCEESRTGILLGESVREYIG